MGEFSNSVFWLVLRMPAYADLSKSFFQAQKKQGPLVFIILSTAKTNLIYLQQYWLNMYMYVHILSYFPPPTEFTIFAAHRVCNLVGKRDWMLSLSWTKHHLLGRLLPSVIIDRLLESIIDLGLGFLTFILLWVSWYCRCSNQVTWRNFRGIRLNLKVIVMVNAGRSVEMRMFRNSFTKWKFKD